MDADIIEPVQSERASSIVLVPEKNGNLQFCIDFRHPDDAATSDIYPLRRKDESFNSLGEAQVLTALCVL